MKKQNILRFNICCNIQGANFKFMIYSGFPSFCQLLLNFETVN